MPTVTPAQEELLAAIRAMSIGGVAVSLFRIGVESAGQEYSAAYRNYLALREQQIVTARRLHNKQGRPLAIKIRRVDDDENIRVQSACDVEE